MAFYRLGEVSTPKEIDYVAWYAAILSTIVFGWDIFKWLTSGAKVRVHVSPNMQIQNSIIKDTGATVVLVKAVNNGERATTITHLAGEHYQSWYRFLVRRTPDTSFVVLNPGIGATIPHVLEPGTQWMGTFQQEQFAKFKSGVIRVGIFHSASERAVYKRLKLPKAKSAK